MVPVIFSKVEKLICLVSYNTTTKFLWIAVENIRQWRKLWSSNFELKKQQNCFIFILLKRKLIVKWKIPTKYVPEVSVMHTVLTLCSLIWCKRCVDEKNNEIFRKYRLVLRTNKFLFFWVKSYVCRIDFVKIKFFDNIRNINAQSSVRAINGNISKLTFKHESVGSNKDL
jgi:hypothetical protein